MGFSVQQARLALAATLGSEQPGQWNVNAAMEILASDGAAHAARDRQGPRPARTPFDNGDEEDDGAYLRRQQRNQRPQRQDDYRNGFSERHPREKDKPQNEQLSDNTASDLLQQASVFGSSMLKSANAYWKTSRAQLQKAIEEKKLAIPNVSGPSSGRSTPNSGRPKWMTEETKFDDEAQQSSRRNGKQSSEAGFKDFDHEENLDSSESVLAVHPSDRQSNSSQQRQTEHISVPSLRVDQVPRSRLDGSSREDPPRSAILLGATTGEKKMYTSPNRRKTAASAPVTAVPPPVSGTTAPKPKPSRPPRPHISATPAQLANSQKHRIAGNEHFKLGQYGEAVSAYSSALNGLPDQHIARVAVLNNRANARLKIGEERQAAEDATSVLDILSAPTELSKVTREVWEVILHEFAVNLPQDQGSEVDKLDAHDALGKALARRARGYEGCEKWRLAMLDWQMITELGDPAVAKSAGGMRVVSEGLSRCKKAVDGANRKPSSAPSAAKRPSPAVSAKPPARTKPFKSEAVDKLRVSNQKAEQEEAESLKVKDSVDAKITEWKAGKETNLRALIASLDNVLWEDLGWKKVGMHELISDSQLKIKYVRAISKVHPDKVCPIFLPMRHWIQSS